MTAPLLLYRMVRDYIKMNKITNKILHFQLKSILLIKNDVMKLLIHCYSNFISERLQ